MGDRETVTPSRRPLGVQRFLDDMPYHIAPTA